MLKNYCGTRSLKFINLSKQISKMRTDQKNSTETPHRASTSVKTGGLTRIDSHQGPDFSRNFTEI